MMVMFTLGMFSPLLEAFSLVLNGLVTHASPGRPLECPSFLHSLQKAP